VNSEPAYHGYALETTGLVIIIAAPNEETYIENCVLTTALPQVYPG
jgi:hypothetical protein